MRGPPGRDSIAEEPRLSFGVSLPFSVFSIKRELLIRSFEYPETAGVQISVFAGFVALKGNPGFAVIAHE